MDTYVGLYYPYIHFRDERWLKSSLLYWDRMQRITPAADHAKAGDSETVRTLEQEYGFIESINPVFQAPVVGELFFELIQREGDRLVQRYGIESPSLEEVEPLPGPGPSWAPDEDRRLTFVYQGKITDKLIGILEEAKLGLPSGADIGLHPRLADVYLTALAEAVGRSEGSHPITSEPTMHVALAGMTTERLAASLLDEAEFPIAGQSDQEIRQHMATLAFRAVLPSGVEDIPLKRLMEFRDSHREERRLFQDRVKDLVHGLEEIDAQTSPSALERELETLYQSYLRPEVERLDRDLNRIGIDTASGLIGSTIPLVAAVATGIPPVIAVASAGVAISVWNVFRARSKARDQAPAAESYLYYLASDMNPGNLARRVAGAGSRLLPRAKGSK